MEFRRQDVSDLAERDAFDLAWLPAVFVAPAAVRAALPKLRAAIKPGGALILGVAGFHGATRSDKINAWRVASIGGTPWTLAQATKAVAAAGFTEPREVPAVPGSTAFLIAWSPRDDHTG